MFTLELVQLWHQAPRRTTNAGPTWTRRRHLRRGRTRSERRRG